MRPTVNGALGTNTSCVCSISFGEQYVFFEKVYLPHMEKVLCDLPRGIWLAEHLFLYQAID